MTGGPAPLGPRLPHGLTLPTGRTLVMGILNVTPDSFSDGGRWSDPGRALDHAREMLERGADLVDVGGESTGPGSVRVDEDEEWRRIGPVVTALAARGVVVSVDTMHAATARRSSAVGAAIINDVSGGRADAAMAGTVAGSGCAFVVQHWRALPGTPEEDFSYGDVVGDVLAETSAQVKDALAAGVDPRAVVVDPGLGFSLSPEQSWEVVGGMGRLRALGYPVLIGASRKRFLEGARGGDREAAALDVTRRAVSAGMWAVRVHDVAPHARLVREGDKGREPV